MRIKSKNGLKVAIIAVALLLCLALAIGITGAFYQAKRQATGTLNMDQGIVIDYKGFDKTTAEEWATWAREVTLPLFETNNAQPGEQIAVNAAGIRANEKSVNFYARVKLSYKFYNVVKATEEGGKDTETEVTLAAPGSLITTSANFFGTNWVDGGSSDGYYYYATGTTLNKFAKTATTFVELFATDAKFIIEGEGFKGSNDLEGGGFVVGDTSINKIIVYLTLETLQGDATAEQAKALGWKIAQTVDFSKVDEGKIVTSAKGELVDEKLNVTINGNQTKLEEVKFPYGEETVLEFDSKNVEYVELTYSDNTTEKFYELEASENSATKNSQVKVLAESDKKVTSYTIGLFGSSEYTGFLYSTKVFDGDEEPTYRTINDGIAVIGYIYDLTKLPKVDYNTYNKNNDIVSLPTAELNIKSSDRVKTRDFELKLTGWNDKAQFEYIFFSNLQYLQYPCVVKELNITLSSFNDVFTLIGSFNDLTDEQFAQQYATLTFKYEVLCSYSFGTKKDIKEIDRMAFLNGGEYSNLPTFSKITIAGSIERIGMRAFDCEGGGYDGSCYAEIILNEGLKYIGAEAFGTKKENKNIILPSTVLSIGANSLEDFEEITIKADVPPTLANNALNKVTAIYVPAESVEAYKTNANWAAYADKIQAIA